MPTPNKIQWHTPQEGPSTPPGQSRQSRSLPTTPPTMDTNPRAVVESLIKKLKMHSSDRIQTKVQYEQKGCQHGQNPPHVQDERVEAEVKQEREVGGVNEQTTLSFGIRVRRDLFAAQDTFAEDLSRLRDSELPRPLDKK